MTCLLTKFIYAKNKTQLRRHFSLYPRAHLSNKCSQGDLLLINCQGQVIRP